MHAKQTTILKTHDVQASASAVEVAKCLPKSESESEDGKLCGFRSLPIFRTGQNLCMNYVILHIVLSFVSPNFCFDSSIFCYDHFSFDIFS